jgi:signal transduction histidine kinase
VIIFSYLWNYKIIVSNNNELVLNKSKAFFEQILSARAWNSSHGGVYVPVTGKTQPNQYLEDSLRDIVTVDGLKLTKINPAYMTRQISEINSVNYDIQFHITSLNPIRPANKSDEWETIALHEFENGTPEILELAKNDSSVVYRFMAPLTTKQSCLQCHAKQGYKEGNIRGGISISFPAALYLKVVNSQLINLAVVHFLILVLGIAGLLIFYRKLNAYFLVIKIQNQELVELNAAKDKFFSIIAHDLKSPFNSIMGLSEVLVEQIQKKDYAGIEKYAGIIHNSSQRAVDLLMNLMEWSLSQTGRMEFIPEQIEMVELINEVEYLSNDIARQKSITISKDVPNHATVFADKAMISAVLRNLVSNAIKFTKPGGQITISAVEKPDELIVSVADTGVGISNDRNENLFRLDESYSTTGTNNEKGTGLGLILCKEFIEKHGGKIWVESQEGKGSIFSFTIPTLK